MDDFFVWILFLYGIGVLLALMARGKALSRTGFICIIIVLLSLPLFNGLLGFAGAVGAAGGLGGAGLALFAIILGIFVLPAIGFLVGWFAKLFLPKTENLFSFLNYTLMAIVTLGPALLFYTNVIHPKMKRTEERKAARIVLLEKRAVERAEQKQQREKKNRDELKLYKDKQKDKVYRFNLAGQEIGLKAFKYLRVSFNSADLDDKGLRLWGDTLEDYENTNGTIDNNDIYRVHVQKNIFNDGCPNTDSEISLIWCDGPIVADINYRPYNQGRLAFEKRSKRQKSGPVFSFDKTEVSKDPFGVDFIPYNKERTWRITKNREFENIYSDIYLACPRLPERSKARGYDGGNCHLGFRLSEEIFVNMNIRIKSESMIENDSQWAVRRSLKYWNLIHN